MTSDTEDLERGSGNGGRPSPAESSRTLRALGIPGSLRSGSYNRGLVQAAVELAPPGLEVIPFDLHGVPPYDADRDLEDGRPESVERLKRAMRGADALLFATPEYNHSVSGVLKNAIDWASRPPSALEGKPAAVVGATPGRGGTARAQEHLEQILRATKTDLSERPGLRVADAGSKFTDDGRLVHEPTRRELAALLADLAEWVRRREATDTSVAMA